MTAIEVLTQVQSTFRNAKVFPTDETYARPTQDFLTGNFYTFYREWLWEHLLYKWDEKFDCDNFASTYYTFSQICNRKGARSEQGIAVGMMFYNNETTKGGHAINFAIVEDKKLITIEPQTGQIVELKQSEKDSCWFCLIWKNYSYF